MVPALGPLLTGFGPLLPRMSGTGPGHEHMRESVGDMRDVSTVTLKSLRVKLAGAVSRHQDVLESTGGGHQIARVIPIAVAFAAAG